MEKGNLNVIIFEDGEVSPRNQRESRTMNNSKGGQLQNNQHQYEIIQQQIQYLAQKIKSLEPQTQNITLFKNDSHFTQKQSTMNFEPTNHTKEILIAIEKKIQIIVKQTKNIIDKLGQSFEKKLQSKLAKKYDELGINKIKEGYNASVRKIEQHYKKEIERISREYKDNQNRMVARMNDVEQKLINKMNDYQIKEKEYIAWIHHLEIQLKDKQTKPKKMIQITQEKLPNNKKQSSQASSIMSNNLENNYSSINQPQQYISNQRISPIQNDTSKIQRKHRIFDNKPSSISPNKTNNNPPILNSGLLQSTKVISPALRVNTEVQQPVTISLATKTTGHQIKNFGVQNQSSPWRIIGESSGRHKVIENVKQEEFYKDVPKPNSGWEKFQDFNENDEDSSDSQQQDVLFYRQGDRHEQFLQNFRSTKYRGQESLQPRRVMQESKKQRLGQGQQKVFSPFDLN